MGNHWFAFKKGFWLPVRWQGALLLAIEAALLFIVFPDGSIMKQLPEIWRDGVSVGSVVVFLIGLGLAAIKTRWGRT
ncbi:hypothetical protein Q1W73_09410 [Asticcacaulis sp. ZE23SCel15]|uniref:hypothetical protein n=1 Tax=Asticcacaulis sp. ZE23SCel15 TaxID=3059027 RepID=UPI00265F8994|nr:hypothetical protein [Asticcacaulis sp. ZE23SCel15]WKL55921.1 hypothetical protein Q1W73_09410 [Asticcacaulis sp. ZE23SCel15]